MDNYNTGATQFQGGFFMPSAQETGNGVNSPAQKRAGSQNQTLRAVTIKQLHDGALQSSDDVHMVDGQEIQNVTLVGRIESVNELATQLKFVLDDGTGKIEVCHWIDNDDNDLLVQKKAEWRPGVYVRVHGNMRTFESKRTIVAFNIRPIMDFNEVTYHLLHCIFQHAHFSNDAAKASSANGAYPAQRQPPQQQQHTSLANGSAFATDNGLSGVEKAIAQVMQSPEAVCNPSGVSTNEVVSALAGQFMAQQVRNGIQRLVDEGHVYTTCDEFHFKIAAG